MSDGTGTCGSTGKADSLNCDFEDGWCGWSTSPWTRTRWQTPSKETGPEADHTFGTHKGHYAYVAAKDKYGQEFTLKSATIALPQKAVLKFWYHMYGKDMGNLDIAISRRRASQRIQTGPSVSEMGGCWKEASVSIPQDATSIEIVGTAGDNDRSDMAIDDISLTCV
jgi:hypothetical protein